MMMSAIGSTNVPQPAIFDRVLIHIPVSVPFSLESRLRSVRKPTSARKMPRISSLRSLDKLSQENDGWDELRRLWTVRTGDALFAPDLVVVRVERLFAFGLAFDFDLLETVLTTQVLPNAEKLF